ncbi:hypothetical protein [Hyphomicrobium sp.]|uniref:hypothetical protein n=1 Tax=Hyphomicrobium sp. TaxID=82 RepID=UPI002E363439|nr:hypothetical protein [Hyphomicrobium sp.]HEX2842147.1 hypothetical protein [Hyphomicrobium sp.]
MNIHIDINEAFADLHEQFREGKLSREEYDLKLKTILTDAGKLPASAPKADSVKTETEQSGCLSYHWKPGEQLSISFRTSWDGQHRINSFPRHVRQAARVELNDKMTELEATKLQVARTSGDAVFEAVMDDLLCRRAEDMVQREGPDTRRAVNLDERFRLADNPDVIRNEDVTSLIGGPLRADDDMER